MPRPKRKAYRGIKTKVEGHKKIGLDHDVHEYDSRPEAHLAELLIKNGIAFTPHVKFKCKDPEGKPFTYEVDFLFKKPQKFVGMGRPYDGLEYKGRLGHYDFMRQDAMQEAPHKLDIFMVLPELLQMWKEDGLWLKNGHKGGK